MCSLPNSGARRRAINFDYPGGYTALSLVWAYISYKVVIADTLIKSLSGTTGNIFLHASCQIRIPAPGNCAVGHNWRKEDKEGRYLCSVLVSKLSVVGQSAWLLAFVLAFAE